MTVTEYTSEFDGDNAQDKNVNAYSPVIVS